MYLSVDEAATHVGNKRFRLVAMVYEQNEQDLIGTACSKPVRVVANNDVPTGAAHIKLSCNITSKLIALFSGCASVYVWEGPYLTLCCIADPAWFAVECAVQATNSCILCSCFGFTN